MTATAISPRMNALEGDVLPAADATGVPTIPMAPTRPTMRFHVGMRPNGPAYFHNVYGICFPMTSSTFDPDGKEHQRTGDVVEMDLEQLRRVREGIRNRIVRWTYGMDKDGVKRKVRGEIWDRDTIGFRPEHGDEPFAPYLILEKMSEESLPPPASETVFAELDEAIKAAEKSEVKALGDPRDAEQRAKAARAKATGKKLDADEAV